MVKSHQNIFLFCFSFLIIFSFSELSFPQDNKDELSLVVHGEGIPDINVDVTFSPSNQEYNEDHRKAQQACNQAHSTAFTKACNEKTYSHVTKAIIASFQSSQQSGDIKKACDSAQKLNSIAGIFNERTAWSCNGALNACIKTCTTQVNEMKAAKGVTTAPQSLITAMEKNITACKIKKGENSSSAWKQRIESAKAFASSKKCSDQVTDTLDIPGKDLPRLTDNNNPSDPQNQVPGQNSNLYPNRSGSDQDQAFFDACTQKPSSPGCQELLCQSMPDRNIRHVCRKDGFESICTNFPGLPQCKHITTNNRFDCNTVPLPLQDECESEGAIAFCQKHSQFIECREMAKANSSDSKKSLASAGNSAGTPASGSGGSGSFGGVSAGSSASSSAQDVDFDEPDLDNYLADMKELDELEKQKNSRQSSLAYGGSFGRGSYGDYKFKDLDFKKLLAKARSLKKDLEKFRSSSSPISPANGLSNFQKVSRIYRMYRHEGKLRDSKSEELLTETPEQKRGLANFNASPQAYRANSSIDF